MRLIYTCHWNLVVYMHNVDDDTPFLHLLHTLHEAQTSTRNFWENLRLINTICYKKEIFVAIIKKIESS